MELVEGVYSLLTNRNISAMKPNAGSEPKASYANPTTSNLIKSNIKDSEMKVTETLATQAKAQQINNEHKEQKAAQRKMDIIAAAGERRHERIETRAVGQEDEDGAQMQFGEVKVKQVDRSVSQLRASMGQTSARSSRMSGAEGVTGATAGAAPAPVKPVLETLSQALANKLQGDEALRGLEGKKDAIVDFVKDQMSSVPAEVVTSVFQDLQTKCVPQVVSTMHQSPREFWAFLSTFLPALAASHGEGRSAALGGFISAVGMKASEVEPHVTWEMFVDFGISKAAMLLKKSKPGRAAILQVMYSFCPNDITPHIAAIKVLQDALGDQQTFMHCLAILVTLESNFNEDLLDLYLYYCVIGLGMPSQSLRAACLSVLPIAANQNFELVLSKLDLLELAAGTDWWEVHAQIVVVLATLLDVIDSDNESAPAVYTLLKTVVGKCNNADVLKIALCHLAPCTSSHPAIAPLYANILLDIRGAELSGAGAIAGLLNESNIHTLSVPSEMPVNHYRLISLPSEWHAVTVATGVVDVIRERDLQNLVPQQLEILHACVRGGIHPDDKIKWGEVLEKCKEFLYVALCDVDVCALAIEVCRCLYKGLEPEQVKNTFETMLKSLRLLFPKGDEFCRGAVSEFLADILSMRNEFKDALLTAFEALPDDVKAAPELAMVLNK